LPQQEVDPLDFAQILPQFGSFTWTVAAFIVALSIIVAIHEYGHYIVGRWSGIHAETFSVGFGPVIYSRIDKRGTKWQIAALPFGGYVKFLGDANAASVGGTGGARNTMLGAPLWARASTVAAGPVFNFILSLVVFAGVMMWQGKTADPLTFAAAKPLPPAFAQPLEPGDRILAISGKPTPATADFGAFLDTLPIQPLLDYTVERAGAEITLAAPYPYPAMVLGLNPSSAAYDISMAVGDVITAIDGQPVFAFEQLKQAVADSDGRALKLDIWRDGQALTFTLVPRRVDLPKPEGGFETRWLIGVTGGLFFEAETTRLGPVDAAIAAAQQIWFIITSSLSGLWHMLTGAISSCNLSGPVGIAQTSGAMAAQGATSFIWFVAVLSTAVGMLNLFPIPVLDGGHLVFHAYEAVTGRQPGDRALRVLMSVGIALIGALMVFALANDLILCP
jgi:regulator of sigma E protease